MKIGLVTYFRENYGSALQCFATKKFLEQEGFQTDVLERSMNKKEKMMIRVNNISKHIVKSIKYKGYASHYFEIKDAMKKEKNTLSDDAQKKINNFIEHYIIPKDMTWKELCALNEDDSYWGFVCGSDQIWNPSININPIYFLKFCERKKRIALSPSFGIGYIPRYNRAEIVDSLKGFEYLSIREDIGRKIIEEEMGMECVRVPDPVFLLEREEWLNLSTRRETIEGNYIFIYFLNEPCSYVVESINEICMNNECKAVIFSHLHKNYNNIKSAIYLSGDPLDFVHLIEKANLIYTDSFHATVFSIMLGKKFLCFERQHLHKDKQESRVTDLLQRFCLLSFYIKNMDDIECIPDYDPIIINDMVEKEHDLVVDYLRKELKRIQG